MIEKEGITMPRKQNKTPTQLREEVRTKYMEAVIKLLTDQGEEVLRTGTQQIALPCVDADNNDEFLTITFSVPTGSRDGDPYDGYAMAREYELRMTEREEKSRKQAAAKAEKKAKDEAAREAKRKAKETHQAEKNVKSALQEGVQKGM